MTEVEARTILQGAYGTDREVTRRLCFGNCCLRGDEKEALLTLIYGEES